MTITAAALGLCSAPMHANRSVRFITWTLSVLAMIFVYTASANIAFSAGLLFATCMFSMLPMAIDQVCCFNGLSLFQMTPHGILGAGGAVDCLLVLAHVWTVAYAFVPYGNLLRESSLGVALFTQTLMLIGFLSTNKPPFHFSPKAKHVAVGLSILLALAAGNRIANQSPIVPYHKR
jgi:hypothetical protein